VKQNENVEPEISVKPVETQRDWIIDARLLNDDFEEDENRLGKGQFGQVYKGLYKETVPVAIKTAIITNIKNLEQFKIDTDREAELMSFMEVHPNVLKFIGIVEDDQKYLIVTELCDHGSLDKYLEKGNKLSEEKMLFLAFGIASGLESLHKKFIVHGDLATRNILLEGDELVPKICDFGLSNRTKDYPLTVLPPTFPIRIMSPEDIKHRGEIRGLGSDIWAFGIIIWQMYEPELPHYDYEGDDLNDAILNGRHPGHLSNIKNKTLHDIVTNCWKFEKERTEIGEIVDTLDPIINKH